MRKNTVEVFKAWIRGQSCRKAKSIWTVGGVIYSYNTPIAKFSDASDIQATVNMQRYSNTTTVHQRGIVALMIQNNMIVTNCSTRENFDNIDRA